MRGRAPNDRTIQLKEKFGGSCAVCGYDKNYAALDFHHVLREEKERGVNSRTEQGVAEADKCVLLCRNCHADQHYPHYRRNVEDRDKPTVVDGLKDIMNAALPGYRRLAVRKRFTPEQYEKMLDHCDPVRIESRRRAIHQNYI